MKVSTKLKVHIMDFVQHAAQKDMTNAQTAVKAFVKFVNTDKVIKMKLQRALVGRLKYATGDLYKSIKVRAYAGGAKNDYKTFDNESFWSINVYIDIDDDGNHLVNALYGEKDQEKEADVPTIESLIDWIKGKRRYFDKQVTAIKRRKDRMRKILQMQRMEYGGSGKFNMPTVSRYSQPEREIAHIIQSRMELRKAKGLSPTKGSEYVFLGNYPQYVEDQDNSSSTASFAPKYKRLNEPLLKKRRKVVTGDVGTKPKMIGEMNRILHQETLKYLYKIIARYTAGKGNYININATAKESAAKKEKEMISSVMKQLNREASSFHANMIGDVYQTEERLYSLFYSVRHIRNKSKNEWFERGQALIMKEIMTTSRTTMKLSKDSKLLFNEKLRDVINELKDFKQYMKPIPKRHAKRRRGR